ncbi:hypothetical protein ACIP8Z_05515 [Streptomyces sp. NPDC088553]|uniref:hypothetical protein n=1 Tax=Streptomyces sp. NPDC088553 TaxID=3365864 RepID=UPI003808856C
MAGARDSAREFLGGLVPALAPETADAVVLLVSELVTHALRHGGGAPEARLARGQPPQKRGAGRTVDQTGRVSPARTPSSPAT